MKLLCSFLLGYSIFLIQVWNAESVCTYLDEYSSYISYNSPNRRIENYSKCWNIQPSQESIIHLKIVQIDLNDPYCEYAYILLSDYTGRQEKICQHYSYSDWGNRTITFVGSLNMTLIMRRTWDYVSFYMEYKIESMICVSKDKFRCSPNQCIRSEQVCDGVEDCDNGLDESECGISSINGTRKSRLNAIDWLMKHQKNFGWGRNTHRAVTSLYLTDAAKFRGKDVNEEVIIKQLQLKTAAALLRNATEPMSVNDLSMYVNALLVTCHDVRNIFFNDMLKILAERTFSSSVASPGAYLTLCNADWPFSETNVHQLLNLLTKNIEYPFASEIQAMAIMALSCLNDKTSFNYSMYNSSVIYNETVRNFIENQKQDGSFGNPHTTALVAQALLSSGQVEFIQWNVTNTMEFLMKGLNSTSVDFLSVYLTLPLFKGRTLVDIGNAQCSDYQRKLEDEEDILDVIDRLGPKIHVQYSLYMGDNKNVIHNIYLKVPENSTVYDVMKLAQIADPKYKFSSNEASKHIYIYEIAGLTNDIEEGKFWLFYTAPSNSSNSTELQQFTKSPDQIILRDKEHLILWYKSACI